MTLGSALGCKDGSLEGYHWKTTKTKIKRTIEGSLLQYRIMSTLTILLTIAEGSLVGNVDGPALGMSDGIALGVLEGSADGVRDGSLEGNNEG